MPAYNKLTAMALSVALVIALAVLPALGAPQSKKVLIKNVKEVGTIVILMDGSKWQIEDPADQAIVYNWLPYQTVVVKKNHELVNMQRGDIVDGTLKVEPTVKVSQKTGEPAATPPAAASTPASPAVIQAERQVTKDLEKATDRLEKVTKQLELVVQRLEDAEYKLKAVELRVSQLERMAGVDSP
jgi:exonuclease VII small subunit